LRKISTIKANYGMAGIGEAENVLDKLRDNSLGRGEDFASGFGVLAARRIKVAAELQRYLLMRISRREIPSDPSRALR
jgi:hypothetical protein